MPAGQWVTRSRSSLQMWTGVGVCAPRDGAACEEAIQRPAVGLQLWAARGHGLAADLAATAAAFVARCCWPRREVFSPFWGCSLKDALKQGEGESCSKVEKRAKRLPRELEWPKQMQGVVIPA